jgi:uncharacterized protein (TIGR00255 family)
VNGRFLNCVIKLPDEARALEPEIRRCVAKRVKRGRVEFTARAAPRSDAPPLVDSASLAKVAALQKLVHRHFKLEDARPLSVAEVVHLAAKTDNGAAPADGDFATVFMGGAEEILAAFDDARRAEGARLGGELADIFTAMASHYAGLDSAAEGATAADRDSLIARLAELKTELPPERLAQEAALLAAKGDIREEIARIKIHLDEMRRLLGEGGAIGRRLDILLQECQRETNTLCAKTGVAQVSALSVELRLLAEQAREQAQNLE